LKAIRSLFMLYCLFLSSILIVQLGFAQTRIAGVSEGDWFKYGFSFEWDSELDPELNMTSEEFPFTDFLLGDWVTLTIQDVSASNVTGQFLIHFENGTEKSQLGSVDLETGEGDLRNWLIAANLNADDSLYATESNEKINETTIETYYWGSRTTNHLIYSYNYIEGEDYSDLSLDMFWDQELGILTELSFIAEAQINGTSLEASALWTITESNIGNVPEFTNPILIISTVSLMFLILIYKRKNVNAAKI
jgi:hypothetical protein